MFRIKNPSSKFKDTEVILRSIYDNTYPDANADGEPSSWYRTFLHNTYNDGIQVHLDYWTHEKIIINPFGEWVLKSEFDKSQYCGETLQLNVNIIGRKIWWFARLFVSLHRERWNQVEPRCAERWHGYGNAEMMSNSTLPLGFLHLVYSWSRVGQLLYFAIFG